MITIEHDSATPPYEQIRAQLAEQITRGQLKTGARLPTVRCLADDLGLAVNTVARAYRQLETGGRVQTRGRAGTYVHTHDLAKAQAETAARSYANVIRSTGLTIDDAVELLRTVATGLPCTSAPASRVVSDATASALSPRATCGRRLRRPTYVNARSAA